MSSPIRSCASRSGWLAGSAEAVGGPLPTTPTFVLPYKRFATPCLIAMAEQFLEAADGRLVFRRDRVTYRKAVLHDRCQIGYPLPPMDTRPDADHDNLPREDNLARDDTEQDESSFNQPVIPPSLPWRFVGWLGGLSWMLQRARQMILKRNPNSLCHRQSACVNPRKARSDARLRTLETAQELLLIIPEWEDLHGCKFFPRFATRSGFD